MAEPKVVPINVSSRVLRHISRGIYRTPAGALKELVSNAYDAGAREVTVTTGWPTIEKLVVTDNGRGLSETEFTDIVQHIGFSKKNLGDEFQVPGTSVKRRTIGHYGIGLLAVGQLASVMRITSKPRGTQTGFTADLDFDQFERVRDEHVERSKVSDEAVVEETDSSKRRSKDSKLRIGKCRLWKDRYSREHKNESFTRIVLTRIRQFVHQHLAGQSLEMNPEWTKKRTYSANYQELLKLLRENESSVGLGWYPYERLIWEMGVYCPVEYPKAGPFRRGRELNHIATLASKSKFQLKIDGIVVRKPFEQAFFEDEEYPIDEIFTWKNEAFTAGRGQLHTSGYLIYKRRIRPKAIQGILVREAGVAIGLYDTTFLHYPFNEGQKFNQLTGEVFATGLSGALNIDRNSFNETDDVYISLCRWFHRKLRDEGVFTRLKQLQSSPQASRRVENRTLIRDTLAQFAEEAATEIQKVRFEELGKDAPLLKVRRKTLVINQDHPDGSGSGAKREKTLLAAALVLRGVVTPADVDEIDVLIQTARKQLRGAR